MIRVIADAPLCVSSFCLSFAYSFTMSPLLCMLALPSKKCARRHVVRMLEIPHFVRVRSSVPSRLLLSQFRSLSKDVMIKGRGKRQV